MAQSSRDWQYAILEVVVIQFYRSIMADQKKYYVYIYHIIWHFSQFFFVFKFEAKNSTSCAKGGRPNEKIRCRFYSPQWLCNNVHASFSYFYFLFTSFFTAKLWKELRMGCAFIKLFHESAFMRVLPLYTLKCFHKCALECFH